MEPDRASRDSRTKRSTAASENMPRTVPAAPCTPRSMCRRVIGSKTWLMFGPFSSPSRLFGTGDPRRSRQRGARFRLATRPNAPATVLLPRDATGSGMLNARARRAAQLGWGPDRAISHKLTTWSKARPASSPTDFDRRLPGANAALAKDLCKPGGAHPRAAFLRCAPVNAGRPVPRSIASAIWRPRAVARAHRNKTDTRRPVDCGSFDKPEVRTSAPGLISASAPSRPAVTARRSRL